jgi:hypothetical protein
MTLSPFPAPSKTITTQSGQTITRILYLFVAFILRWHEASAAGRARKCIRHDCPGQARREAHSARDTVRVIDAMAVYKDANGELEVEHLNWALALAGSS